MSLAQKRYLWEITLEAIEYYNRPVTTKEVTDYIKNEIPNYKETNTPQNISMLTVNSPSRVNHHSSLSERLSNEGFPRDKLFKIGRGLYEIYSPEKHGIWRMYKENGEYKIMEHSGTLLYEIKKIEEDNGINETTRKALIDARIGQGNFRKQVIDIFKKCPVTGVTMSDMLRASHIKPWSESNNTERLDPHNGIILSAHIDVLFDKGHISFSKKGKMLLKKDDVVEETIRALKIEANAQINFSEESKIYLEWHRDHFQFKE